MTKAIMCDMDGCDNAKDLQGSENLGLRVLSLTHTGTTIAELDFCSSTCLKAWAEWREEQEAKYDEEHTNITTT